MGEGRPPRSMSDSDDELLDRYMSASARQRSPPARRGRVCGFCCSLVNKGTVSTGFMALVALLGALLTHFHEHLSDTGKYAGPYLLSMGIYGLGGGLTNYVAVMMLFYRVPLLYGSGVIPANFKRIRREISAAMMELFFDKKDLETYVARRLTGFVASLNLEVHLHEVTESKEVDEFIDERLQVLADRPEGMYLSLMGIDTSSLKPLVKMWILSMGSEMAPLLTQGLQPAIAIDSISAELKELVNAKLLELTPQNVKKILEDVIKTHLGWLVVWGNVFGGILGLVAQVSRVCERIERV